MMIMNRFALLAALSLCLSHESGNAAPKTQISDEVLVAIKDNYRIYREQKARKVAEQEIKAQIERTAEPFQNNESVQLPICDYDRSPFQWKFFTRGEDEDVATYMGAPGASSQFMRWTESAWVRVAGPRERFKDGMFCGPEKFIGITIDQSLAENYRNRSGRPELIDGVILHLASKVTTENARFMQGEVELASVSTEPVRVALELWSMRESGFELVTRSWHYLSEDPKAPQTLKVEGNLEAQTQTLLVVRLDPALKDKAAKGEASGRIYLFSAAVHPKS
jgi:hypothetical protein